MMLAQVQHDLDACNNNNMFDAQEIGEMGYSLALFGVTPLQAYTSSLQRTAKALLESG
eukprot:CAMPEP_0118712644 /NCGR_PEP_ID=MMETSP0800-20121206/24964_1 /TAXON_ID=210618 ORGANISM="Striatella unipunctata, Strain CCMP2910" /NCGR_SAMPLE_ID=MMETSP0800 /ASSEMBLY_ACC=CAM_ASM_000638 /LENGTH=57 /DNA_ID=CAMNT_0006617785 /DNA_START=1 /DNA_END=170 /DNA_ORIENTATION=-